jgi:hypothetical protein
MFSHSTNALPQQKLLFFEGLLPENVSTIHKVAPVFLPVQKLVPPPGWH